MVSNPDEIARFFTVGFPVMAAVVLVANIRRPGIKKAALAWIGLATILVGFTWIIRFICFP